MIVTGVVASALIVLGSTSGAVAAQPYSSKPIHFVVPFPPGNAGDLKARMPGERRTQSTKQPVIVENRPGAGGNIGADFRKRLDDLKLDPGGDSPEEFSAYVRTMSERVGRMIRNANIRAE